MACLLFSRPRRALALCAAAAATVFFSSAVPSPAYTLDGASYPDGPINMVLSISETGVKLTDGSASFNAVAADALNLWNPYLKRSQFVSRVASPGSIPRDGDGINTVFSAGTIYGDPFGEGVLAVTLLDHEDENAAGTTFSETDVIINQNIHYDSYRGNLHTTGLRTPDLHRVLLHEFGHVLGLDHPDQAGQNVVAIMNSHIGDLDHLAADDIAGAHFLYDSSTSTGGGGGGANTPASFAKIGAGKNEISKIVYSKATGNLYTIGKKKGKGASRLTIYNPYTLAVVDDPSPIYEHAPDNIDISDDGRYLYLAYTVDVATPRRISRFDLFTNQVDEDFAVVVPGVPAPALVDAIPHVVDLKVAPGEPDVLAVSEGYGVNYASAGAAADGDDAIILGNTAVVIYDQGQPRANAAILDKPASGPRLQFAGNTSSLLTTPQLTEDVVHRLTVSAAGAVEVGSFVTGHSNAANPTVFAQGLLYNGLSQQYAPVTGTLLGTLLSSTRVYALTINAQANALIFLSTFATSSLQACSLSNGRLLSPSVALPAAAKGHFENASLISWGEQGLALGSPTLRGLFVARSVTFGNEHPTGGTPDTLTLKAPAVRTISQNAGQALKFRVRRESASEDSSPAIVVHYKITGTGVNGVNFKALTGSVTIPARKSQVKFKLVPQADSITDGQPVTVSISLVANSSYVVAVPATATVTITP